MFNYDFVSFRARASFAWQLRRAKDEVHGIGEGKFFHHHEKVDGVSMKVFRFPNPVAVFDDEIAKLIETVILTGEFLQGEASLTQEWSQRDFASSADVRFGPVHRDDFSSEVE